MKKTQVYLIIITLLAAAAVWFFVFRGKDKSTSATQPTKPYISQHSAGFNQSLREMMESYYKLTEAFVNWDSSAAEKYSVELNATLDSLKMEELMNDSLTYRKAFTGIAAVKSDLAGIIKSPGLEEQRQALNMLSRSLYSFLHIVRYDIGKVYYQECPMAFDDIHSGYWLSSSEAVRNPYLGTKHPKYKSGMLKCGGPKDTLNFMQ